MSRGWLGALAGLLLVAACGGEGPGAETGEGAGGEEATGGGAQSFSLPREIGAACDSAAARWSRIPGTTVVRTDTLFSTADLLTEPAGDGLVAVVPLTDYQGCHVFGEATAGLDPAQRERLLWQSSGWPVLPRVAADGVDGSVRTYQQGRVRCQVAEEWDGRDDSDTTAVPAPFFRERTLCWLHTRELVPADTAQAPG